MAILYQDQTVTICGPRGWRTIRDEKYGEDRWCFHCRARREFRYIVGADADILNDWYGPSAHIECATCKTTDGDVGFGRERLWED